MEQDCYLPFHQRRIGPLTAGATLTATAGDPAPLRNGYDRQIGADRNSWDAVPGDAVTMTWDQPTEIKRLRLVFDPDLSRTTRNMRSNYPLCPNYFSVPPSILKEFKIELDQGDGHWITVNETSCNHQRLVYIPMDKSARRLRFTALLTWGAPKVRLFAMDIE
ncbi:MAG: hypothetical protein ABR497_01815 [Kiritimatiellia bacterium]